MSKDEPGWKWVAGSAIAITFSLIGIVYGALSSEAAESRKDIVTLKVNQSRTDTVVDGLSMKIDKLDAKVDKMDSKLDKILEKR